MDLITLLNSYRIPFKTEGNHHCRPGWVQIDCPFCEPGSQGWHLGINMSALYANCWRCGFHNLSKTLAMSAKLDTSRVTKDLNAIDDPPSQMEVKRRTSLQTPYKLESLTIAHRKYLRGRGFDPDHLTKLWGLKGIGIDSRLPWRIWIPIHYRGEIVSWTTRSISDEAKPRYISASAEQESMDHKTLLYGEDYCRHAVIVVEGPTDVWKIGPGAVALLGTSYKREQVQRLAHYLVRVVCFDNEVQAQSRMERLLDDLSVFDGDTYGVTLNSDPGEATENEITSLRHKFLGDL